MTTMTISIKTIMPASNPPTEAAETESHQMGIIIIFTG